MKKSLTFLMLMLCCIGVVFAKPVDSELAKKVALNFLKSTEKVAAADLTVEDFKDITATTPFHEFYVFSIHEGRGFILVSGDDRALPILGYSLNNPFVSESMPENARWWLGTYEEQISQIRTQGIEPSQETSSQWRSLLENSGYETTGGSLGPLLCSTWGQGNPYNDQCPYYEGSISCGNYSISAEHAVTGCVATATAQVMKYWNWPATGANETHSYTCSPYGTLTVNYNTSYSWSNMPTKLTTSNTSTQINAVAKLMYHVGVAYNMSYSPCGSGAYPSNATSVLPTYFKYNSSTISNIYESNFTTSNWLNSIKSELNLLRPILYSGWDPDEGGHTFVCDGYNSSDQLHFNWGWGGNPDGYFTIGSLNPSGYHFNSNCCATIGIKPNSTSTFYHVVTDRSPINGGYVTGFGSYTSGSTCTLTATALPGHQFVCWTEGDNIVSSNATYSFTVSSNRYLFAVFSSCTEIPDYNYQITPAATWFSHTSSTSEASCYKKIYRFPVLSGVTYTFKTGCSNGATADFDTKLLLYNSSGSLIMSNDDDDECGNGLSRLVYTATYSGNAFLVVTGWNNRYGNYSLAYKKDCTGSNTDYNYTITPSLISWNTHSGTTVNTCDGRIYRISVSPDYTYTFKTGCDDGATASFDTRLYLYNSSGDQMVSNDDDSECGNGLSRLTYHPTTSGYIYVRVTGFAGATGTYTLAYKKECIDVPNYHYTLTPGTIWNTVTGSNTGDCNKKIYRFSATANQPYVFKTGCGNGATATFDTYLEIYDANGNRLAYNDDGGCEGTRSKLEYTPTTSGYQYLVVSGYQSANGSYTLAHRKLVSRTITVTANPTAGGLISGGGTYYQGDTCTLIASPASGYTFTNWTSGSTVVSTNATYRFSVSTDRTLTANFVRRYTITASANPTAGGTVTGGGTFNSGNSCTLRATPATGYVFTNWTSGSTVVSTNAVYTFTVSANRTLKANFTPAVSCNIELADLPYTENFDSYTTSTTAKTGVSVPCWTLAHQDVSMTDEYKPMVYYSSAQAHSGNYSLILNKRCIFAMPQYLGNVSDLQISFYLCQTQAKYQLQVGVMSDLSNASTFVPVATINNSSTTASVLQTVDFASYSGSGRYIAFRNVLASGQSGDYSCNYIDDITLELRPASCPAISAADLPYSDNFDSYSTSTTAKTGVEVPCWTLAHQDVTMADEYKPMVYYSSAHSHSGSYSIILNKRGIFAMPEFDGDVSSLQLSFYVRQTMAKYQLQVGVMSDLSNASTFVPVATINNSSTTASVLQTVDFASYSGSGRHIAFRNVLASGQTGDYSCNYIDDITLELRPSSCPAITAADLPYSDNFDSYTTSTTAKTGVDVPCWTLAHQDVTMADEYKPMVYYSSAHSHSGSYSIILNKRGIFAMPEFDGDVSSLQLSFYVRQTMAKYQLQVGVMSDLSNASTFVPVATINNSSTTASVLQTVDFASYSGSGRYIAFRNVLASGQTGDYSCNYIDDITLELRPSSCPAITAADLPYTENFDSYTTSTTAKTGVSIPCWTLAHQDVSMTDEYKPMVYYSSAHSHSGSYSIILNKRGIFAMPEFDGDVNTLQLSFYVRQTMAKYQLQVGVMSDLSNAGTFVPVATINNSSTSASVLQTVNFASYSGSGHYIAFRNVLASGQTGDYSCNYIDDITLELRPSSCPAITAADLPYTENFDSYTTSTTAKTGVSVPCWTLAHQDVAMADEYKPMVYYSSAHSHSGNYSIILNKRGIFAMPEFDGDVSSLQLTFYVRQTLAKYQLQVGVMSDLSNAGTFVPVATINNSSTTASVLQTVDFASYSGSGRYIAFRNVLASGQSGDYSCNYIDDITLELRPSSCPAITAADLPYSENFDNYTTSTTAKTGVSVPCWTLAHQDVSMTDEYKPMVYYSSAHSHSGNYSIILNKRGIFAMPEFDGDVSTLQLSFYVRQTMAKYQLQVGVMSDLSNASSFVPVATINNSSTTASVLQTVDFASYSGSGRYIAFRNVLASGQSGDYSCNYIDDIRLETRCAIYPDELPYSDNFDSYTTSTTAKTGVSVPCWTLAHQDVAMTDEYKPMVYYSSAQAHSGSYSVILNKRCIFAMPQYLGNVRDLQLTFYLCQTQAKYQLQVGVMSDLSNASTFVPVATINNSSTTVSVLRTVNFSAYTGSGRYIAFRNILASGQTGDYSCNYIDNITLSLAASKGHEGNGNDVSDNELLSQKWMTVFPNPTSGMISIESDGEIERIDIFDYTGRCVATFEHQSSVDLSGFASGLYTLRCTLPDRIEVRRVVKQ